MSRDRERRPSEANNHAACAIADIEEAFNDTSFLEDLAAATAAENGDV